MDIVEKKEQELAENLDLFDLEMPDTSGWEERLANHKKEAAAAEKRLKPTHGSDWYNEWMREQGNLVTPESKMQDINTLIYNGIHYFVQGLGGAVFQEKWEFRMHELYGKDYGRLRIHKKGDPEVVELLLQDALKTGKWQELPDCLQDEYKKRIFGWRKK